MARQGVYHNFQKLVIVLILVMGVVRVEALAEVPEVEVSVENAEMNNTKLYYDIIEIPDYPGKKTYMSYKVFGGNSNQNQLQERAVTDGNGLRMVDGRYCIAVGTVTHGSVGQYIDLVLSSGLVIPCIIGDIKADKDTDKTHTFSPNGCCSEFIVNMSKLDNIAKQRGDVSFICEAWQFPVKYMIIYKEVVVTDEIQDTLFGHTGLAEAGDGN